jgi:excisionase family DNA binding protein
MKKEELLDLISQTEAARLRGVSPEAIADLIRRGRLSPVDVGGKRFLRRSEVESFEKQKGGRPLTKKSTKKASKRKT